MRFARKAWFSVTESTIKNCFTKAGFRIEDEAEPTLAEDEIRPSNDD